MQNSLYVKNFLIITIADALDPFRGRVDLGDRASLSSPLSPGGKFSLRLVEMGGVRVSAVRHTLNSR